MQPADLANQAVNAVTPYLPKAAQPLVSQGKAGDARALFVTIESALLTHHQEPALHGFIDDPYGLGGSNLKRTLAQILQADPAIAAGIQSQLPPLAEPTPPTGRAGHAMTNPHLTGSLTTGSGSPILTTSVPPLYPSTPAAGAAPPWPAQYLPTPHPPLPYPLPYTTAGYPGAPATISDRFLARLIDSGLLIAVLIIFGICNDAIDDTAHPLAEFISLIALTIMVGYEFFAVGKYGKTVGKHVMKLRIVTLSGGPPGWGAAAARSFIPVVANCGSCGLLGVLFYLSPLFDKGQYGRGWHDQIASTVVIRAT